ncbi:alpha/beta fold hydrolase [Streptomyces sp. NPDC007002]|uniref:alpha/beta fold hydrolase n=1 Tax=Streptomyces sp. NPDC007002 TaxID=3156910 RepID=UPI00345487D8
MPEEIIRTLSAGPVRYGYRVLPYDRSGGAVPRTEPTLILGGALQGMFGWPQMDDHLGPATDVVTADLPGMGGADPLPPGPSADLLRRAVLGIADDLGAPRLNIFGFSYGTAIAFGFAQRHPDRVARLALGGVPVHIDAEQAACWERARRQLAAGDRDQFAATAADALMCLDPERPVHRRELARRYVRRSFLHALTHSPHAADSLHRALADRPDFTGGLAGVPALVFAGEHDTVTSPARQREFAATIEDSRFLTIGESDHWVVLERAEEVASLVTGFFTGREPAAGAPAGAVAPGASGAAVLPRQHRAPAGRT